MPHHPTPPQPQPTLTWQYILYEVRGTLTCPPTPTHTRHLSSVATRNVVKDPRDLSNMAIYHVRSTRNVNMPPPPHATPTPRQRAILKKEAKRTYGFLAVGMHMKRHRCCYAAYLFVVDELIFLLLRSS